MSRELSSDILENQFGTTVIEVLGQDEATRIIATKDVLDGKILEISRVVFKPLGVKAFREVHELVVAGQSMGKAFRAAGVEFERVEHSAHRSNLPEGFNKYFGSDQPGTVVGVSILVGQEQLPYANILEIYSPLVSWEETGTAEPEQAQVLDSLNKFLLGQELVS